MVDPDERLRASVDHRVRGELEPPDQWPPAPVDRELGVGVVELVVRGIRDQDSLHPFPADDVVVLDLARPKVEEVRIDAGQWFASLRPEAGRHRADAFPPKEGA
jgi:hypothetical protein